MQSTPFKAWPLVVFVAIAYGIVWLLLGVSQIFGLPFMPLLVIGSWSPNIAAFIVIGLVLREKGGIRALFAGWAKWKLPVAWYLAALSAPAIAVLALTEAAPVTLMRTGAMPTVTSVTAL